MWFIKPADNVTLRFDRTEGRECGREWDDDDVEESRRIAPEKSEGT